MIVDSVQNSFLHITRSLLKHVTQGKCRNEKFKTLIWFKKGQPEEDKSKWFQYYSIKNSHEF